MIEPQNNGSLIISAMVYVWFSKNLACLWEIHKNDEDGNFLCSQKIKDEDAAAVSDQMSELWQTP